METNTTALTSGLETPNLPEVMVMNQDEFNELSPGVLHPNAAASKTAVRPAGWNEDIAKRFYGKVFDTTGWTYLANFNKLNVYERWCGTCSCHEFAVNKCPNNETVKFHALDWQDFLKHNLIQESTIVNEETGEVTQVVTSASNRVPRGTYKQAVNPDDQKDLKNKYLEGATIQELSEEYKIAQKPIRDFFSEEGILRKRGQSAKPSEFKRTSMGRARSTIFVTPELTTKVADMLAKGVGGGVVAIAKAENVNPSELSKALKEMGVAIKKGNSGLKKGFGRKRTTIEVTNELAKEAAKLIATGKGLVVIAKDMNVNPNELSKAVKALGVIIKKGKRTIGTVTEGHVPIGSIDQAIQKGGMIK